MKDRAKILSDIYRSIDLVFSKKEEEVSPQIFKKRLSCLYFPGESFHMIFRYDPLKLEFINSDVYDVLGFDAKEFNINFLLNLVHAEDMDQAFEYEKIKLHFLSKLNPLEKSLYKVNYHVRLKTKSGPYKTFLFQEVILGVDDQNNISRTLGSLSDITRFVDTAESTLSIIDLRGKRSYFNIKSLESLNHYKSSPYNFTKREIEIIKYISEGYLSKMISDTLFISEKTVKTHRRNILQKSGLNTMHKVISECIKGGII